MSYKADFIKSLNENTILDIYNHYCENWAPDDVIYPNDEENVNMLMGECTPYEVLDKVSDDYSKSDEYLRWTIYGLESTSDLEDWVDFDDLERVSLLHFVDESDCIEYLAEELNMSEEMQERFEEWLDEEGYTLYDSEDWESIVEEFTEE